MEKRNPHYIGEGEYIIHYKDPTSSKTNRFYGVCENFSSSGLSAFWDKENEQMLLVVYRDIIGLYPINQNFT